MTSGGNDAVLVSIRALGPDNAPRQVIVLVSKTELIASSGPSESADIQKGLALDRYLSHLLAQADILAWQDRRYAGSALTRENFEPNVTSGATAIHAKWGGNTHDVLRYLLAYERMRRWCPESIEAVIHLLATEDHAEWTVPLRRELESTLGVTRQQLTLQSLASFANDTLNTSIEEVQREIRLLETLAANGFIEQLRGRAYQRQLGRAARLNVSSVTSPGLDWQSHVAELATADNYEILTAALEQHVSHHSLFWERDYHLTLVRHCSYLLAECLQQSDLSTPQKEQIRNLIIALYPELERYPDAWRLLQDEAGVLEGSAEGQRIPTLTSFDLLGEIGASRPLIEERAPELSSWTPTEAKVYLDELLERSTLAELFARLEATRCGLQQERKEEFTTWVVDWVRSRVLDIEANPRLPQPLDDFKELGNYDWRDFIKALAECPAQRMLFLGVREISVTAGELHDRVEAWVSV
jgi:hypothetical protein